MLQGHRVKVVGRPGTVTISAELEARILRLLAGSNTRPARSHLVTRIDPAHLAVTLTER